MGGRTLIAGCLYLVLTLAAGAQGWTDLGGGDHGGASWTPATGSFIAGVHTGVGEFRIPAGETVYVEPYDGASYGSLEIHAVNIIIEGTLDGEATGFRGGDPGPAPGTYGLVGEGPGAGQGGYGSPSNVYGRGGGGGGYGGNAGNAGNGGATPSGEGGPSYGVPGLVSPPPSDDDIQMGSGGGGGGQQSAGGLCTPGGNGGGAILLIACTELRIPGTVTVRGGTTLPTLDTSGTGGGGSGGGLLLQGDLVLLTGGTLDASGGDTGDSGRYAGSGGGGGRVKIVWNNPASDLLGGTIDVSEGAYGATVFVPVTPSMPGTVHDEALPPPECTTCTITSPAAAATVGLEVTVTYDGDDPQSDPVDSTFEFSTDAGATWQLCTASAASPVSNPDLARATPFTGVTFIWDSIADGVAIGSTQTTTIRITVTDGVGHGACSVEVTVDNSCAYVLCGDCNGDGAVSIVDALYAAQIAAGLVVGVSGGGVQFNECNVTGTVFPDPTAAITILDALEMARYAAGLITLSCC